MNENLLFLTFILVVLIIFIITFFRIANKNRENKKKFVFSLISFVVLTIDLILFISVWYPCLDSCDMLGEALFTMIFLVPIAGFIILCWVIYWLISYFRKRKRK